NPRLPTLPRSPPPRLPPPQSPTSPSPPPNPEPTHLPPPPAHQPQDQPPPPTPHPKTKPPRPPNEPPNPAPEPHPRAHQPPPAAIKELSDKLSTGDRLPRRVAEQIESQTVGQGGSDRMRAVAIADSAARAYDSFRVYMCRVSSLAAGRAPQQYSVAWKQTAFV